jgi:hypothetical protein
MQIGSVDFQQAEPIEEVFLPLLYSEEWTDHSQDTWQKRVVELSEHLIIIIL